MTFLPIVERELREGARRKSTRRIRLVVAAVALALSLFQLTFIPLFMRSTAGSAGFRFMTGYAFVLCLLAGVFITADCLSEEKREGTLGLLFLTDLRGYDVVLGKLASQLVHLGYALLAIIPAAALPLLLGGVTGGELWRISLALLNLLFFSLAAGLLASAISREAGRAMLLTGAIVTLVCVVAPMVQSALDAIGGSASKVWLSGFSPAQAYSRAMESSFVRAPGRFWISLGISHLLSWFMIGVASWRVPRSWQDRPAAKRSRNWLDRVGLGTGTGRVRRRRELLRTEPLRWLIGESWAARTTTWGFAILWALGMITIAYFSAWEALAVIVFYGGNEL